MNIREAAFYFFISTLFFLVVPLSSSAQEPAEDVRLSGMVVDAATIESVPYVTIKNRTQETSILSDSTGFFDLVAQAGDTLVFEAMTYQANQYIVPEDFSGGRFAIIEALKKDAVLLEEFTIRGFPSQEQFEREFVDIEEGGITDKTMRLDVHLDEVTADPTNMEEYILDYNRRYRTHMTYQLRPEILEGVPNNFLNPERWVRFIQDWQEGKFTERNIEKLEGYPLPDPAEAGPGDEQIAP